MCSNRYSNKYSFLIIAYSWIYDDTHDEVSDLIDALVVAVTRILIDVVAILNGTQMGSAAASGRVGHFVARIRQLVKDQLLSTTINRAGLYSN